MSTISGLSFSNVELSVEARQFPLGVYRHNSNKQFYKAIAIALSSEGAEYVFYQLLYGNRGYALRQLQEL